MLVRAVIMLIAGYRRWLSPLKPATCRFFPTCSAYAQEALERHGLWRGAGLALVRLARCGPWHPGGFDPVPGPGGRCATKGQRKEFSSE